MKKHLMAYAPAKIIPGLISFLSIMLFARIFTIVEYGNYSYLLSVSSLIFVVIFAWIRLSSFRFFNIYSEKLGKNNYLNFVFSINIWLSIVVFVIIIIFRSQITDIFNSLFFLAAVASIATVFLEQVYSLNRAELKSKEFRKYSIISPVLKLIFVLIFFKIFSFRESSIFIGTILSSLIITIYYIWKVYREENLRIRVVNPFQEKKLTKEFFKYGLPLTFSFLFSIILSSSDRILIKFYLNEESVALYSMSYDLTTFAIGNIFMILNFTFLPVILKLIDTNKTKIATKKVNDYFETIIFTLLPVIIFMYYFSPEIVKYVLGEQYDNQTTIEIMKVMSIVAFLSGLKAYFFDFSFQAGKKTVLQVIPIAIGAVLNILLNIWWLPVIGLKGSVYATLISVIIALLLSIILGRTAYRLSVDYKKHLPLFLQILLISILVIIMSKLSISIVLSLLVFVFVYLTYFIINLKRLKKILQ